ncbi:hypothetical protein DFH06DRAFT_1407161 [Mycena polygramma]|nr:hypothetical protein DFH06DRAFT_1407161 [Mycena polygramma]
MTTRNQGGENRQIISFDGGPPRAIQIGTSHPQAATGDPRRAAPTGSAVAFEVSLAILSSLPLSLRARIAPKSHLRRLGELILDSIDAIEARLDAEGVDFPSLVDPFKPSNKAESVLLDAEVLAATSHIVAAASQLIVMVRSPVQTIMDNSLLGIHANEIAKINDTDPAKAARILRLLANHHIFTDIRPDVFFSNRLSSVLDSDKSVVELKQSHTRTDEAFKGSSYLSETFTDPATARRVKATDSPWNVATKTDVFLFDWYDLPKNEHRKTRFSFAMACSTKLEPPEAILAGLGHPWCGRRRWIHVIGPRRRLSFSTTTGSSLKTRCPRAGAVEPWRPRSSRASHGPRKTQSRCNVMTGMEPSQAEPPARARQARAKSGQSHGFLVVNFAQSWLGLVKSQARPKPTLAEAGQSQGQAKKPWNRLTKEVLDDLLTLLNSTPRIKDGPEIGKLSKSLAIRIQGDANINCVMTAAACMQALAKAMLGSFARYRELVVGPMLERLKERKANVTDSIGDALDAVFSSTTLSDIIPDLGCLSTASSPIQPAQIKPLAETLAILLEDGFEGARTEAATCLGTLMKMVGERPLNPVMEGLPDMRKSKVKEAFEWATVKCKAGAAAPPKAAPLPVAAPAPKKKAPAPKPVYSQNDKLGDLKLKKPAGDTLLVFAEKTSLRFVLNQAYDPLSKQKAPKVLADALTWINTALMEFGIVGLSLRSLIEFLKTALQNSNAAVRTSATKTLVTVKLFAGSSIKDFLEDLNAQLLNTINTEFDKVEGNPAPEPSRTSADLASMVASSSTSTGAGASGDPLDDLFPRVEVDGLLKGTTILADAKNDSWKTKKEGLEALQSILDQGSNKRLKSSMGDIGQVLKARVTDTNKAVQNLALDIVARIATGMGKPFEKHSRLFTVLPVAVLSDQKAPIRAAAIKALTAIAAAREGLDSMVQGLHTALEMSNPLQKGTLMHWIADWFGEHELASSLDLSSWTPAIVCSLDDRSPDVRKGAQALLPTLISSVGYDHVIHQTNSLKPASRNSAMPRIQAARASAPRPRPASQAKALLAAVSVAQTSKFRYNKLGVRRKLPQGSSRPDSRADTPVELPPSRSSKTPVGGLRRPGATSSAKTSAPSTPPPSLALPFSGTSSDAKKARLGKDASKWINEGGPTRKDLADLLQTQMELHTSKDLVARWFSHDHNAVNDHLSGLTTICDLFTTAQGADAAVEAVCLANFDLPLKYASIKLHEPQPNLVSKCLEVVETVLAFLRSVNYQLTDNEALCFIPTVVYKLGDAREPVRVRVQQIMQEIPKVYAYSRLFQILLEHGLKSKVAKTRQGALDEMGGILKKSGMAACEPSKGFPIIAGMISGKDSQVRKSALGALGEGYTLLGEKVWTLVGPLPAKDKTQLEEPLRRVPGPSNSETPAPPAQVSRLAAARLGLPRPKFPSGVAREPAPAPEPRVLSPPPSGSSKIHEEIETSLSEGSDDITITISSIQLSSDPTRSVDALKKIQKILAVGPDAGPSSPQYRELAEHTEGLIETITLQMAHVFDRPEDLVPEENFRLAKHLVQTLNTFCDHAFLAESLTADILTSLLEELTLRLLETDDSTIKKVKDLSRFINMIVLRLFATGRRMSIFRALFALLLQIVKPFPGNGTAPDSKESKVAELVLKCVWKLARNIPQDLTEERLDPVELFPAIEHFLQSVPPNEWRARATNKVPCGDMPLRTIKVIIQHVVAFYGDDVYDLLSASFDDPSATIPYVYRILNSNSRPAPDMPVRNNGGPAEEAPPTPRSPASSRPMSRQGPPSVASGGNRHSSPSHRTSPSSSSHQDNGAFAPPVDEPDPDAQLLVIIGHISSETTGALHKEGITELHHFLKAYPHKRPRVDKMLESTGAAIRKYITRVLASRAAEDQERDVAVADTLSKLESNHRSTSPATATEPQPRSPKQATTPEIVGNQDKLSRLHNLFQYRSKTLGIARQTGVQPDQGVRAGQAVTGGWVGRQAERKKMPYLISFRWSKKVRIPLGSYFGG